MSYRILAKQAVATVAFNMANTPITQAAWVQILASLPQACTAVEIFNGSPASMKFSHGAIGSESAAGSLIPYTILPGGSSILLPVNIPVLSPISVEAIDQTAATGYLTMNFFG